MAIYTPAPQFHNFDGLAWSEWKEKCLPRWVAFQNSIDDSNRNRVRRLAMSHWHTLNDFVWVDKNLPKLTELDLSDIQDTIISDGDLPDGNDGIVDAEGKLPTWAHGYFAWAQVLDLTLWERLEKLWVRHWGCDRLHDSKHRHVNKDGWMGFGFADGNRIPVEVRSRRERYQPPENVATDITAIIAQCEGLRTLAIRGPSLDPALSRCWRPRQACLEEEGSHAHVCAIVKGLEGHAPKPLRAIEFYQAEFAPQIVEMLRDRTQVRKFSISFGDILRRYSPGREVDIGKDDPFDRAVEHAKFLGYSSTEKDEDFRIHPLYPKDECLYHITKDWEEDLQFHDKLNLTTFPRSKLLEWLSEKDTQAFLSHWARSPRRSKGQAGPEYVFSDTNARLAEYLLVNREERPLPGLNLFLVQLFDAFDAHLNELSCNDAEIINTVPVSFFSFIDPTPNPLHHPAIGIFGGGGDDDNGDDDDDAAASIRAFDCLHRRFGWAPLWDADPLFGANFPWTAGIEFPSSPSPPVDNDDSNNENENENENEELLITSAAARLLLGSIVRGLRLLAYVKVPVRLLIGNRPRGSSTTPSSGTGFYWGASTEGDVWRSSVELSDDGAGKSSGTMRPWFTFPVADGGGGSSVSQPSRPLREQPAEQPAKSDDGGGGGGGGGESRVTEPKLESEYLACITESDPSEGPPYTIAGCVDELVVRYQDWTGVLPEGVEDSDEDDDLVKTMLVREARGWQRWWRDCALAFTRLRKLRIRMPVVFDRFKSHRLATVLRNGVGRGRWSLRGLEGERGRKLEFVVREWVRRGGPRDVVFGEEEKKDGHQELKEEGILLHDWRSREREVKEGRRLWEAFFRAGRELKIPDWPEDGDGDEVEVQATPMEVEDASIVHDDPGVPSPSSVLSVPETQMYLTPYQPPVSPPVEPITPAQTPPLPQPQPLPPPGETEQLEKQPKTPTESVEDKEASPVPDTPPAVPSVGKDLDYLPTPKKPRKGRAAAPKQSNISRRRTRARNNVDQDGSEEPPLPKKAKTGKKSRWERELEALQG